MRTLEELKQLLNPNGERNGKWTHVPVAKRSEVEFKDRTIIVEDYVELHEVYFDQNGEFLGITKYPVNISGNDIEDLKLYLELMLKSCNNNPVITEEEKNLIFNS